MVARNVLPTFVTEELVRLGHEVTLSRAAISVTAAELAPCVPRALRLEPKIRDIIPYYMLMLDRVFQRADEFDIFHFHIDQFHFPLFRNLSGRTVTTLHGRQDCPTSWRFMSALRKCRWSRYRWSSENQSQKRTSLPIFRMVSRSICIIWSPTARWLSGVSGPYRRRSPSSVSRDTRLERPSNVRSRRCSS